MRFLIQRVTEASVLVRGEEIGRTGRGFLVFAGVSSTDTEETADLMVRKMLKLRIFEDEAGKTNLSLADVGGSLLIISQFTLYANCKKGNRPSFTEAGAPDRAEELYNYVVGKCKEAGFEVGQGAFGEDMKVRLSNDGPFTIWLDSDQL